jgi:hypothetical protein
MPVQRNPPKPRTPHKLNDSPQILDLIRRRNDIIITFPAPTEIKSENRQPQPREVRT